MAQHNFIFGLCVRSKQGAFEVLMLVSCILYVCAWALSSKVKTKCVFKHQVRRKSLWLYSYVSKYICLANRFVWDRWGRRKHSKQQKSFNFDSCALRHTFTHTRIQCTHTSRCVPQFFPLFVSSTTRTNTFLRAIRFGLCQIFPFYFSRCLP